MTGYAEQRRSQTPTNIDLMGGRRSFRGNIQIENELVNKVERELAANFIANNDEEYIVENYQKIAMYLTTSELKRNFNNAVQEIINMQNQNIVSSNVHR